MGPNSVEEAPHLGLLQLLSLQFESPLVPIRVFAATIPLVPRQWVDAGIILSIVLGSSLPSFAQEYRASTVVEDLRRCLARCCCETHA